MDSLYFDVFANIFKSLDLESLLILRLVSKDLKRHVNEYFKSGAIVNHYINNLNGNYAHFEYFSLVSSLIKTNSNFCKQLSINLRNNIEIVNKLQLIDITKNFIDQTSINIEYLFTDNDYFMLIKNVNVNSIILEHNRLDLTLEYFKDKYENINIHFDDLELIPLNKYLRGEYYYIYDDEFKKEKRVNPNITTIILEFEDEFLMNIDLGVFDNNPNLTNLNLRNIEGLSGKNNTIKRLSLMFPEYGEGIYKIDFNTVIFTKLEELISENVKIKNISGIAKTLQYLQLDNSSQIDDYSKLPDLKKLVINNISCESDMTQLKSKIDYLFIKMSSIVLDDDEDDEKPLFSKINNMFNNCFKVTIYVEYKIKILNSFKNTYMLDIMTTKKPKNIYISDDVKKNVIKLIVRKIKHCY